MSAQCWIVTLEPHQQGGWSGLVTVCGSTTKGEPESYEFSGSSSPLFQELLTVLDATIFTFLAIAEERVPEGQLPLL